LIDCSRKLSMNTTPGLDLHARQINYVGYDLKHTAPIMSLNI